MKSVVVPVRSDRQMVRVMLEFLSPVSKLTRQENDLLSALVYHRSLLVKQLGTVDPSVVDKLLFSAETRKELMQELGLSYNAYTNILSRLRSKKAILPVPGKGEAIAQALLMDPSLHRGLNVTFRGV